MRVHYVVERYDVPSRIQDHVLVKIPLCSFSYFSVAAHLCIKPLSLFKNHSSLSF